MEGETEDETETVSEEKVIEIAKPAAAEVVADAEVEDGDEEDDDEDAPAVPGQAIIGEPYVEGECTVTLTMVIHPKDGNEAGPLVNISASSHDKPGSFLITKRMREIGTLPTVIKNAIALANGKLVTLKAEQEEKARKEAESKAEAKKKAVAAQEKKDAPKKAKLEKAKQRKIEEKARADKKKADEKAKKEKAILKAKADKQKAEAKAKADREKALTAEKKLQEKQKVEAEKIKPVIVETIQAEEPLQSDMFGKLFGGKKK